MRIGIVVWSLLFKQGGVERVGVELAKALVARGHEVIVFCHEANEGVIPRYPLDRRILVVPFAADQSREGRKQLTNLLVSQRLDVLVAMFSWRDMLWFPIVLEGTGIPLVISEHNHPKIINENRWNRSEREAAFSGADRIHVLLQNFIPFFPKCLQDKITVIPNAVPVSHLQANPVGSPDGRRILIAVGRFDDHHKQFSLLIEAFSYIQSFCPQWDLRLYGEGRDEARYRDAIAKHALQQRVVLMGTTDKIHQAYAQAQLFCIPSRYEGFGLVTVEAHRHGLPAVGFAECTGTNEIIRHGENGLLAPEMSAKSLGNTLLSIMLDDDMRAKLGTRAMELAHRYDPEPIYDQWESLLLQAAVLKGRTALSRPLMISEYDILRFNLNRISERQILFDEATGPDLYVSASQNKYKEDIEKLKRQRNGAWKKIELAGDYQKNADEQLLQFRKNMSKLMDDFEKKIKNITKMPTSKR